MYSKKPFLYNIFFFTVVLILNSGCQTKPDHQKDSIHKTDQNQDNELVALVQGMPVYRSDLLYEAKGQGLIKNNAGLITGSPLYEQILDDLIDQKLLAHKAQKQKLDQDPLAQKRLMSAQERILGNIYIENAIKSSVTEEAVRKLYQEQVSLLSSDKKEIRARHILVKDKKQADQLRKKLLDGADFAILANQYSIDKGTQKQGGDLGYFTKNTVSEAFEKIAFSLPLNTISEPFQSKFGWHIIEVIDKRNEQIPSYEDMKGKLVNFLSFEAVQSVLKDLKSKADIKKYYLQKPFSEDQIKSDEQTDSESEISDPVNTNNHKEHQK